MVQSILFMALMIAKQSTMSNDCFDLNDPHFLAYLIIMLYLHWHNVWIQKQKLIKMQIHCTLHLYDKEDNRFCCSRYFSHDERYIFYHFITSAFELFWPYHVGSSIRGLLMITLDIICFVWIFMKKGSMCNHQSIQDRNNLEIAYASRIVADVKELIQDCSIFYIHSGRYIINSYLWDTKFCVEIKKI